MSYKSIDEIFEYFEECDTEALYPTDLKEAIIGVVERFGMQPLILLDREKCIQIFIERDGMTEEEAEEFFEFNTIGAWMGEGTPCFATLIKKPVTSPNITVKVTRTTKPLDCKGIHTSSSVGKTDSI